MIQQPEPQEQTATLTPAQKAKREHWAQVLLANASDVTSYRLAERLIRDWFGEGYDERLASVSKGVKK